MQMEDTLHHKVYMAGPISGLTYDGAENWRDYVKKHLETETTPCLTMVGDRFRMTAIQALSPLRNQEYLRQAGELTQEAKECLQFNDPLTLPMGLTNRDRFDATRCDVLFVNFQGASRPSLGTAMEIAWADLSRIPIVIVTDPDGNPNDHAMITSCATAIVHSLDEGIRVTKSILGVL